MAEDQDRQPRADDREPDEDGGGKRPARPQDDKREDGAGDDSADDEGDDKPSGLPLYKRPLFWIVGGGIALILIVGGLLWWLHARQYQSTDDAFIDTHIVRIAAQVSGQLVRVPDGDNRHVRKGQLLAVIEPGQPEAQVAEAVAGVAQADAAIEQAEARVLSAQAARRQAIANAAAPAAEAARAAREYQRYLALRRLDAAAAAPVQIDQARAQAETGAAQAAAARRQIDTASADIVAAGKEIKAARAQKAAARARVAQANVTLGYLRIRAPIDGQIVNRQVNRGSYVAPGQQLMAIVPDEMWVTANFKETQLQRMRRGQPVDIRIDAYPQETFAGHVDSIQRGAGQAFSVLPAQNATGNYVKVVQRVPVRILFDGANWRRYAIGPGMSVVPRVKVR